MLEHGYHCRVCLDPLLIFEIEDWTEEEWAVCRKLFGFADEPNVTRIVAHVEKVECWNELKEKE